MRIGVRCQARVHLESRVRVGHPYTVSTLRVELPIQGEADTVPTMTSKDCVFVPAIFSNLQTLRTIH